MVFKFFQEPFYYNGLILTPACIGDYTHDKVWDENTYLFLNSNRWSLGMNK